MMPVDEQGNVYIRSLGIVPQDPDSVYARYFPTPQQQAMLKYLYVISPQGTISMRELTYGYPGGIFNLLLSVTPMSADNGIVYAVNSTGAMDTETFSWMWREDRLNPDRLMAYDAESGAELWNFTVPAADKHFVMLNMDTIKDALPGYTPEIVDGIKQAETRHGWRPDLPFLYHYFNLKL
jgi:outer membrane protein assembly factor BamB